MHGQLPGQLPVRSLKIHTCYLAEQSSVEVKLRICGPTFDPYGAINNCVILSAALACPRILKAKRYPEYNTTSVHT